MGVQSSENRSAVIRTGFGRSASHFKSRVKFDVTMSNWTSVNWTNSRQCSQSALVGRVRKQKGLRVTG